MASSSSSSSSPEQIPRPPYTFGVPWPELNEGVSYTDAIKSMDSGKTLIEFYSSKYKNSAPLQGWIQRIKNGQIRIDGDVITDPDAVLRVGCEVVYCRLPWKEPDVPYLLEVLYEDEDMVAINKPSGLQVLPGGLFQQRTVLRQLQWKTWRQNSCCSTKYAVQDPHPAPVHRLGRGTSGILLCAKTKQAKICLAAYFAKGALVAGNSRNSKPEDCKARGISKFYRALVTGLLNMDEIVIRQPIGVMHYPEVATGLYVASPSGKPALSKVQVLERDLEANHTRVEVIFRSLIWRTLRLLLCVSIGLDVRLQLLLFGWRCLPLMLMLRELLKRASLRIFGEDAEAKCMELCFVLGMDVVRVEIFLSWALATQLCLMLPCGAGFWITLGGLWFSVFVLYSLLSWFI